MVEKIEKLLENDLICAIVKGITVLVSSMAALVTIAAGFLAMLVSVWWLLVFVLCGILTGALVGICIYLFDIYL